MGQEVVERKLYRVSKKRTIRDHCVLQKLTFLFHTVTWSETNNRNKTQHQVKCQWSRIVYVLYASMSAVKE